MEESELKVVRNLLLTLSLEDLNSLVFTVTQSLIKENFTNKEEAVSVILRNSSDVKSILKRKLVTREVLFNFLNVNNIKLYPPHTKDNLIESFLSITNIDSDFSTSTNQQIVPERQNGLPSQKPQNNINEMAIQFSEWFYRMFNQNSPLETSHFWQDCNLKLNLKSGDVFQQESVKGDAQETVDLLYRTKMQHNILLNPNLLSEGCQGRMDLHGVVVVLACGTVHQGASCVGVFEQVFALVRDPSLENNWKIKFSELNLRSQTTTCAPRLTDTELTANLLQLES